MQNETQNQDWDDEKKASVNPADALENAEPVMEENKKPLVTSEAAGAAESTSPLWEKAPAVEPLTNEQPLTPGMELPAKPPVVEETAKESGFKKFLRFLFGSDTRVGRVMRPFLRTVALFVIGFTAGLLITYLTIYQPLLIRYNTATIDIQRLNVEKESAQANIRSLEGEITALQATMASQQAEIELANYKVNFLIVKNDVLQARLALADESNGPGGPTAMTALNDLETHLQDLLPYVQAENPVLADLLTSRLDVVQGELVRDAQQAKVELESFNTNLLELETTLFE